MAPALLAVKFYIPQPRTTLTDRPQLLERFTSGLALPLTLISAPAGFGKSTLLSAGVHRHGVRQTMAVSWLSLDAADDSAPRFWTYIAAAIQTGLKNLAGASGSAPGASFDPLLEFLQSDPPPAIQPVLDELINTVAASGEQILLVLDDYHGIHSPQIHEQMAYLLDHQPPNLHLVISTRVDPPLPISRLRARGQLSEFRAADLRFTPPETADFFKTMTGVEISGEDVTAIQTSTEGWIAGLQMAALALQAQAAGGGSPQPLDEKIHQLFGSFSGKHTYVLDYLADEVFNRQPEEIQAFLLKTSVLERLCAPLCDALKDEGWGMKDEEDSSDFILHPASPDFSRKRGHPSSFILDLLDRSNLFLVPLDEERIWFRYHHLFADLLRVRLDQRWPELKPMLHRQASEWYERSGSKEEAIRHAVLAQDWERAAALIEREIQVFLERGQLSKVMEWVALLPKEVSSRRIELLFQQAYVMGLAHRMKEFVPLLEAEEQALADLEQSQSASQEEINRYRSNLNFQKGYVAIAKNNPQQGLQLALEGIRILPPGCPWEESWLLWTRAYANRSLNHLPQAVEGFQEAFQATQAHGNLWTDMVCLTDLAMVYHLQGDLKRACEVYSRALELGKQRGAAGHSYLNRVQGWMSLVLIERNEIEAAWEHARAGQELSQYWPSTNTRSVNCIVFAQLEMVRGDLDQAGKWLELAEAERQKSPLMPVNNSLLESSLVRYWLAQSSFTTALEWARPLRETWRSQDPEMTLSETVEAQWAALARVLIALGQSREGTELVEAVELLERIERSARSCGRVNSLVEACALKAAALQTLSLRQRSAGPASPEALQALEAALAAGEPGGYVRVFINEGPLMAGLLNALRQSYSAGRSPACSKGYLDMLLRAFPEAGTAREKKPGAGLPEPLTDREMEVLRLIAAGLSNKEAAEKLVLSEGTIKTHLHNIMGKLDAQSRTQAIARARELAIL